VTDTNLPDKERILFHIISRIYPKYILDFPKEDSLDKFEKSQFKNIKVGDLILACTSGLHNFTVGFADTIINESNIILREIGSQRTCNISNEMFYKIPFELLGKYELFEGVQYKTYIKVQKAISNLDYCTRFHSMDFNDNKCIVNLRQMFSNEITQTFEFAYSSKTTIKEITRIVKQSLN